MTGILFEGERESLRENALLENLFNSFSFPMRDEPKKNKGRKLKIDFFF